MKNLLLPLLAATLTVAAARSQETPDNLVWIEGGAFKSPKSNYHGKGIVVEGFYIGKYEVTQKEWSKLMGNNPSKFKADDAPVETVTWYDCIDYCNRRSLEEGLEPYYVIDKNNPDPQNDNELDDLKWTVTVNARANGYRLPTEAEWEYAASGGQATKSFTYSGSNDINEVAWFWQNSGVHPLAGLWNWPQLEKNNNRSHPVGSKAPNELGLYDMSGNVREWCWDWFGKVENRGTKPEGNETGAVRVWKGGGWMGGDFCCEISYRSNFEANGLGSDQGFRVCRNK